MDRREPRRDLAQLDERLSRGDRQAEHVAEHADRDLETDPGEEADQHGPREEVGEEAEPEQACAEQQGRDQ